MPGPPPAVAACRTAVRAWLRESGLPPGSLVLVACSGGADSLALVAAAGFVGPRQGLRVGAVVVDHGLQDASDEVAQTGAAAARALLEAEAAPGEAGGPVLVVPAQVEQAGAGPEAQARSARYAVLVATSHRLGAAAVLVGHTADDQAEQVLLGLLRGSGARSLAGMPSRRVLAEAPVRTESALGGAQEGQTRRPVGSEAASGDARWVSGRPDAALGGGVVPGGGGVVLGRPLLGVGRAQTRQACAELGVTPWEDPHNIDGRFARVRARQALADLEDDLGPGVVAGLVRSAALLRDDADALDEVSGTAYLGLGEPPWEVGRLRELPRAVRTRLWRRLALAAGSPATDLTSAHLLAVDGLVTDWRGQGPLPLPGGVRARREGDRVWVVGRT